jgi:PIN domain nuclease of toxin-antitoxin system
MITELGDLTLRLRQGQPKSVGKEPGFSHIAADVSGAVAAQGLAELAITMRHAEVAARLPLHHKDPMDRLLIAQALVEDMTIVTIDRLFTSQPTKTLW